MHKILPQFPLKIVVFPGEFLNLHIFEPRYKQLINECKLTGQTFGITAYINDEIQAIGTELELIEITKVYDNGEMDIKTKGIGLYRVIDFRYKIQDKLYPGAKIEEIELDLKGDTLLNIQILKQIANLYETLSIQKEIPIDPEAFNTYQIGHHIGLNLEQEYELLSIEDEVDRQAFVIEHLGRLLPIVDEMENLRKRVQLNGHFKNLLPPELRG